MRIPRSVFTKPYTKSGLYIHKYHILNRLVESVPLKSPGYLEMGCQLFPRPFFDGESTVDKGGAYKDQDRVTALLLLAILRCRAISEGISDDVEFEVLLHSSDDVFHKTITSQELLAIPFTFSSLSALFSSSPVLWRVLKCLIEHSYFNTDLFGTAELMSIHCPDDSPCVSVYDFEPGEAEDQYGFEKTTAYYFASSDSDEDEAMESPYDDHHYAGGHIDEDDEDAHGNPCWHERAGWDARLRGDIGFFASDDGYIALDEGVWKEMLSIISAFKLRRSMVPQGPEQHIRNVPLNTFKGDAVVERWNQKMMDGVPSTDVVLRVKLLDHRTREEAGDILSCEDAVSEILENAECQRQKSLATMHTTTYRHAAVCASQLFRDMKEGAAKVECMEEIDDMLYLNKCGQRGQAAMRKRAFTAASKLFPPQPRSSLQYSIET